MKLKTLLIILCVGFLLGIISADDPQCGKDAGGALCRDNLCCSKWGFCGSTPIYCEVELGCQSQCWNSPPPSPPPPSPPPPSPPPPSPPPPSPPPPPPSPPPPSPPPPTPPPPSPPPPSLPPPSPPFVDDPQCGKDAGGALCRDNLCCSKWGFCGSTPIYCEVEQGCQSQCWNSPPPPSPPPPSPPPPSLLLPSSPPPPPPPPCHPSRQERPDHRCRLAVCNSPCGPGRCCSWAGWCGDGNDFCHPSVCQYQCWDSLTSAIIFSNGNYAIRKMISTSVFDEMFKHRDHCPSQGFYNYDAFITATASFPRFGTIGDIATRKRELAAFFAQTSQATAGQWFDSYEWGYCHINETTDGNENVYCTSPHWPCPAGKKYNARGPMQLTHNYNYGLAGEALGLDLINNPDLVATDPVVSFKTAIWYWMAQHDNKPSSHDILVNANSESKQVPSYGVNIGNTINSSGYQNVVGYYKRYCDILDVSYGDDLNYWYDQTHSEVASI